MLLDLLHVEMVKNVRWYIVDKIDTEKTGDFLHFIKTHLIKYNCYQSAIY